MKTNFLEQAELLKVDAIDSIKSNLKQDKILRLISEEDAAEAVDAFYELPTYKKTDKHGYYEEYSVVAVKKDKMGEINVITLYCEGRYDSFGNTQEVTIEDLGTVEIFYLADSISTK